MTDWDERYREGDTPWEKGAPAPPLLELLEGRGVGILGGGPVLVPGCGLGHDVRAIAERGLPVVGVDLSPTAISRAEALAAVGAESYEVADFLDPGWQAGRRFSAIWEHTCFCAIDPSQRPAYAAAVAELLLPGGVLAGVFFLNPWDPGESCEGPPFPTTVAEVEALLSQNFEKIDGWSPQRAYPGREGREWIGLFRRVA
jgi:methyl halide transferase